MNRLWEEISSILTDAIIHPPFPDIISFPPKCPYFAHVSKENISTMVKGQGVWGFILFPHFH